MTSELQEKPSARGLDIEMSSILADQKRPRIWAQMRGKGGVERSPQPMRLYSVHRSPKKLWRTNYIFHLCLQPSKENIQHLKTWNFFTFYSFTYSYNIRQYHLPKIHADIIFFYFYHVGGVTDFNPILFRRDEGLLRPTHQRHESCSEWRHCCLLHSGKIHSRNCKTLKKFLNLITSTIRIVVDLE